MSQKTTEPFEHYNSAAYQKTVDLERMAINGMKADEVYKREAAFALRSAGYDSPEQFGEDEEILDVASGAGNHACVMFEKLGRNVPIMVTDPSDKLGKLAEETFDKRYTGPVRTKLACLFDPEKAKMQNLTKDIIGKERKIKLITVLGSSFGYTNMRESEQAFRNTFDILEPGGSLVLQWRQRPNKQDGADFLERKASTVARAGKLGVRNEGEVTFEGEKASLIIGTKGEKYYCMAQDNNVHPDPEAYNEYSQTDDTTSAWRKEKKIYVHNNTGTHFQSFRRILIDERGERFDLPPTTTNTLCWEQPYIGVSTLTKILNEIGFTDIEFKQPMSDEDWLGEHRMLAIVAKKPL